MTTFPAPEARKPNEYRMLSHEYYDAALHPTCANFRDGSEQLIASWLSDVITQEPVCEVGAGQSIVAEMYYGKNLSLNNVYLTDSAQQMLAYSARWQLAGAHLLVADATELPFRPKSVALCVASLGDPYNKPEFWDELRRTITSGGHAIYTTPSFEWAREYRLSDADGSTLESAEFLLGNGQVVSTPSVIRSHGDQISMIEGASGLKVVDVRSVAYSQLRSAPISAKLITAKDRDDPIVTGYMIRNGA